MAPKLLILTLAVLLGALVSAAGVAADAAPDDPLEDGSAERWIPGMGITSSGFVNERRARVESVERGLFQGDSRAVYWSMGVDADLLSPKLDVLPLAPRVFVRAGASMSFDNEDPVANDDDPGKPEVQQVGTRRPVSGVTNRGSATKVETRPLGWSAAAGLAFDVHVADFHFRVKPSVEWLWQKDRIRAALTDAQTEGGNPTECGPCRLLRIDTTTTEAYHSIGPGIEIEADGARLSEDVVLTVFTGFQALVLIGSTKSMLRGTGVWRTNGVPSGIPDSTVTSRYERDRWSYRFGVGVRFRWLPD